jgi:DNA replication protein DnaC
VNPLSEEDFLVKREYMLKRDWPARAVDAAFKADLSKPAIVALGGWDSDNRNVVVLSGSVGVGKTVAAARWCMERSQRIRFVRATTFAASSRYDRETRELYYNAAGLCLDDVGTEYADKKESFLVDLDELIDTFYADCRPLLVTTNLRSADFQKRYGARVWDRLNQCANWRPVNGSSMRKPA